MKKEKEIKIKEKVIFTFAYLENAERVAIALAMSGYYVRISKSSAGFILWVYTNRDI